jgi:Xaa-Pro aminopeptidase
MERRGRGYQTSGRRSQAIVAEELSGSIKDSIPTSLSDFEDLPNKLMGLLTVLKGLPTGEAALTEASRSAEVSAETQRVANIGAAAARAEAGLAFGVGEAGASSNANIQLSTGKSQISAETAFSATAAISLANSIDNLAENVKEQTAGISVNVDAPIISVNSSLTKEEIDSITKSGALTAAMKEAILRAFSGAKATN